MRTLGFGGPGRLWKLELSVKEWAGYRLWCGGWWGWRCRGGVTLLGQGKQVWEGRRPVELGGHRWGPGVRRMSQTQ